MIKTRIIQQKIYMHKPASRNKANDELDDLVNIDGWEIVSISINLTETTYRTITLIKDITE